MAKIIMTNRNLNSQQFGAYRFKYGQEGNLGFVEVRHHTQGYVGHMYWNANADQKNPAGHITSIAVLPKHQKKGLATEMYKRGQKSASRRGISAPNTRVTNNFTPQGDKWRKSIEGSG